MKPRFGAHISVVRGEEENITQGTWERNLNGPEITFYYSNEIVDVYKRQVCEYVIQSAIRDNKTVKVEENTLIGMDQWEVLVNDDENTVWHFCIHVDDTKDGCEKWVKENGLTLEVTE